MNIRETKGACRYTSDPHHHDRSLDCYRCRYTMLTAARLFCDKHSFRVAHTGYCVDFERRSKRA